MCLCVNVALFEKVTSESVSSRLQSLARYEAVAAMIVINGRQLAQIEWKRVNGEGKRQQIRMRRGYVLAPLTNAQLVLQLGRQWKHRDSSLAVSDELQSRLHHICMCCVCQRERDWDAISKKTVDWQLWQPPWKGMIPSNSDGRIETAKQVLILIITTTCNRWGVPSAQ